MGLSEGEERTEEIFKIVMTENFSKLMLDTKSQIQKAWRTSSRLNAPPQKKKTPHTQAYNFQNTENQR